MIHRPKPASVLLRRGSGVPVGGLFEFRRVRADPLNYGSVHMGTEFGGRGEMDGNAVGAETARDNLKGFLSGDLSIRLCDGDEPARKAGGLLFRFVDQHVLGFHGKTACEKPADQIGHEPGEELGLPFAVNPKVDDPDLMIGWGKGYIVSAGVVSGDFHFGAQQIVSKIDIEFENHCHLFCRKKPGKVFLAEVSEPVVRCGNDLFRSCPENREIADGLQAGDKRMNLTCGQRLSAWTGATKRKGRHPREQQAE